MKHALVGTLVTAAISTAGDYLWANVLPHHLPVYWFAHAIVLFVTIGACLGWPTSKPLVGAIGAALVGCVATLGFYFLQPLMGYSAMFPLFVGLWLGLGVLTGRVAATRQHRRRSRSKRAGRGRVRTRVLRDLRDLDAVQSPRLGLRAALCLLDVRLLPGVRGAAD